MIHKFNRTQIEQSFSLTNLINIKTHFLEMSMYKCVCMKLNTKVRAFLNFSKSLLSDCHFSDSFLLSKCKFSVFSFIHVFKNTTVTALTS